MIDDYGIKIGTALRAVKLMYSDSSRLLQDCDGAIGEGRSSIFGGKATADVKMTLGAKCMAEGFFRYYDAGKAQPGLVEGVAICFFYWDEAVHLEQPLLVVGRTSYANGDGPSQCQEWDLWESYLNPEWKADAGDGTVIVARSPDSRMEWAHVAALPLYGVANIDDVRNLMQRVREFKPAKTSRRNGRVNV